LIKFFNLDRPIAFWRWGFKKKGKIIMQLLTKEIEDRFKKTGSQQNSDDPEIIAKFFDPTGSWKWYATEYNPTNKTFYGLVHGHEKEWGYFSLEELESVKGLFGLGIERDLHFGYQKVSAVK
jgi:hypothetical protein